MLQKADAIWLDEIRKAGLYDAIWQAFAVLLPVKTVGVMGDARTYEDVCALRAVSSLDGMTAEFSRVPWEVLDRAATRHRQRGVGNQPGHLRHHLKAPRHHRVGMKRRPVTPPRQAHRDRAESGASGVGGPWIAAAGLRSGFGG